MAQRALLPLASCLVLLAASFTSAADPADPAAWTAIQRQFHDVPMEARRVVQPLFWLHGDESKERLELFIEKMAEGHNGGFVAESRPHSDWLGEGWYRDLDICLQAAKKHDLQMWIFDEKWWPSQTIAGNVEEPYRAKSLSGEAVTVEGPFHSRQPGYAGKTYVAAVAGKVMDDGIDGATLVDLAPCIRDGMLEWDVPPGKWEIMKFNWIMGPRLGQGGAYSVDGASQDCVDWFIQKVYQPHYDRFGKDFGKTIAGFFYDEPEVRGDWGTEVAKVLAERGVDWKKALVAYKFKLAGEEQTAAFYQYLDAFYEAWGRTMYGTMSRWCQRHGVKSIGHFMDHTRLYIRRDGAGAGNLFQLQKYSAMGAIDLVVYQLRPGTRWGKDGEIFQLPKIASSISHVYDKPDQRALCEIFGGYGQELNYSEMKWLADQHQVRGLNFMVPHSFNPKAPNDTDYPPYFYMEGEPRFPLYRVWADYNARLSTLLTGGRHVCPVALLFCGNSMFAGKADTPDDMAAALQDALLDNDWLPYDAFEDGCRIEDKRLKLHEEQYRVLVVPPVEVIPYKTLAKAKEFFDAGGVVVGYGIRPSESATLGRSSRDIEKLAKAIWGENDGNPGLTAKKTNRRGGRSYFLPAKPTAAQLRAALIGDGGIHPTMEVIAGQTDDWVHVLHRVKAGRDIFFIVNQNYDGSPRQLKFRAAASGEPQRWDAMRNQIAPLSYQRIDAHTIEFVLTLQPSESTLIVFGRESAGRPVAPVPAATMPIARSNSTQGATEQVPSDYFLKFDGASWVWYPEAQPQVDVPGSTRYFRQTIQISDGQGVKRANMILAANDSFTLYLDGREIARGKGHATPMEIDLARYLTPGKHVLAIAAANGPSAGEHNAAGLIGAWRIGYETGWPVGGRLDKTCKTATEVPANWTSPDFDDSGWPAVREIARYGQGPWGRLPRTTRSPVVADPFVGTCTLKEFDRSKCRAFVEMDNLPDQSAAVTVNGQYAGGTIGQPCRVEITAQLKPGENTIEIQPLAPKAARVVLYASGPR
jgi:hypothetical protein